MAQNQIVKSPSQIKQDLIRVYRAGLITKIGIPNPQVDAGSDADIKFTAIGNELSIAANNVVVASDAQMADTATGADLDRVCKGYGLSRRPASTAPGFVFNNSSQSSGVLIATAAQLISTTGLIYQVETGGTYKNTDPIKIVSVDKGSKVNLDGKAVLTWLTTPPFSQTTVKQYNALVPGFDNPNTVGIEGGTDEEDDETLRARLFALLQNPPLFGNWSAIAKIVQEFEPNLISSVFVYPAANGPSTQHLALTTYANKYKLSRAISDTDLDTINSFVQGNTPEYNETVVTTVNDVPMDISVILTIPYPVGNSVLGTGGGWVDDTTFPIVNATGANHDGISNFAFAKVVAKTSTTNFTIAISRNSQSAVIIGSSIAWIDRTSYTVIKSSITDYGYIASNQYNLTIDFPFSGAGSEIQVGDWIMPAAENLQTYVDSLITQMALLGPGEKTNVATLLPRAKRKPLSTIQYPNTVDSAITKNIITNSSEVLNADYNARMVNGSEIGQSSPSIPTSIANPPNIFIPRQIGFYAAF